MRAKHTGTATDIVESKLSYSGIELQKKRQRLANATGSTENGNLGELNMTEHTN